MKKKLLCSVVVALLMIAPATTAFAGTWSQRADSKWQYIKDDGNYARNEWIYDNGSWYYFMGSAMATDEELEPGIDKAAGEYEYYLAADGRMAVGFTDIAKYPGCMYFADKDGHIIKGFFMVEGVLYYTNGQYDGVINKNWHGMSICNKYTDKTDNRFAAIDVYKDGGKVLDKDGKPFSSNNKFFSDIKYLPKYDSKGNLIGAIQN